jgi:hypothetical protein
MGTDIADKINVLYSDSYGIGRFVAVPGQDNSLSRLHGYGKAASISCQIEGLDLVPSGLTLARGGTCGALTFGPIEAPEFDWLVPWWNADCAGSGTLTVFLQVETTAGWSDWVPVEQWGRFSRSFSSTAGQTDIVVDTDTVLLAKPSKRFNLRFVFSSAPLRSPFDVKLDLKHLDPAPDSARPDLEETGLVEEIGVGSVVLYRCGVLTRSRSTLRLPVRTIYLRESAVEVPTLSQMDEAPAIRGRICSPTCATMALATLGHLYPTAFVAADCFDFGQQIYGNWAFNVASLWRLGARARLDFFASLDMASAELFAGKILITSIRFQDGSLRGAPIQKTNGHLVLIKGLTRRSDSTWAVLVNDPAAPNRQEVARVYDSVDFDKAWSGLAYVVEGAR